jgi:hypothetical protein
MHIDKREKENEYRAGKSEKSFMRSIKMILAVALLIGSVPASAMKYKGYQELKKVAVEGTMEAVTLTVYLAVLANTFTNANFSRVKKGKTPLYCQPESLSLNNDTLTDILETRAEKTRQNGAKTVTASVSTLLLEGLRETFPCT